MQNQVQTMASFLQTNKYNTSLLAGQSYGGLLPSAMIHDIPPGVEIHHIEKLLAVQGIGMVNFNDGINTFIVLDQKDWPSEVDKAYHWPISCSFDTLIKGAKQYHEKRRRIN